MKSKCQTLICLLFLIYGNIKADQPTFIDSGSKLAFKREVDGDISSVITPFKNIASYIVGAALLVALIIVIYHVASNTGKGKTAVISWLIAIIIYLIAFSVFG
jgi:hypothetical protein